MVLAASQGMVAFQIPFKEMIRFVIYGLQYMWTVLATKFFCCNSFFFLVFGIVVAEQFFILQIEQNVL
jgi:hypothetical protein